MKQEYILVLIAGLLILAYVLDAVVDPLPLDLITPYHYFTPEYLARYAFTTTSIIIKAIAVLITPLWLLSFAGFHRISKGTILLVISGLLQLYSLQDVVTSAQVLPLEWDLSLTLAGVALLIPTALFLLGGAIQKMTGGLVSDPYEELEE